MKNGKIILGIAAFIGAAASILAFKGNGKFSLQRHVYGKTAGGTCTISTCFTSNQFYNSSSPGCHTRINGFMVLQTSGSGEFWRNTRFGQCTHPTIKWTHTN